LNRDRHKFAEAGAALHVIGQGTPADGAKFLSDFELELDLLVDTHRRAYKAAGTKVATLTELVGPKMVARGLRRSRDSGVFQGKINGHPAQLGGMMLITPGGHIPWAHLSDDASDYPPNDEVLATIARTLPARDRSSAA
jgi:hypothetical protein